MKIKFVIMALAALIVVSCGGKKAAREKQEQVTRQVKTSDFCGIEVEGNLVVEFSQDSVTSVTVSGCKGDVDDIKVTCRGGVLRISHKANWGLNMDAHEVYVKVSSPNLTSLDFTSSGAFSVKGDLDTDTLKISMAGSGEVAFNDVICDRITLDMGGSGATSFGQLRCGSMAASLAGSGELRCEMVQARTAYIDLAGSGSAYTQAAKIGRARLSIAGSGDITINGAEIGYVENGIAGSGDILIKGKVGRHKDEANGSGDITVSE